MPPPLTRFQGNGQQNMSPYPHQFPGINPSHSANHPQLGGNPSYLQSSQNISPFTTTGNVLGMAGGMNGGGGFGVGSDTGLGSQQARMSFAHGANLQQQQHAQQQQGHSAMGEHPTRTQAKGRIQEVWKHNLEEEMAVLRGLVEEYPYIAMDTEFPGVVARPMGGFRGKSDYHYQCLRTNVDMLKVIQIGITLFNEDGETPAARPLSTDSMDASLAGRRNANQSRLPHAWQFNFKFSLEEDMYNQVSIDSLQQAGINFALLEQNGIDPHVFASLLIPSGLCMFPEVKWVSFHGGYDFGYLTKLLMCKPLPNDEDEFSKLMKIYFPSTYDVKHLMKYAVKLHNTGLLTPSDPATTEILQKFEHKSGLENFAEALKLRRTGSAHQAGSDSLLTGRVFFSMREKVFNGEIPDDHLGKVWGLGVPDIMGMPPGALGSTIESTPPQAQNSSGQNGTPSTPNTGNANLVHTPAAQSHNSNGLSMSGQHMTPGNGGGVFGSFAFSAR